MRLRLAPKASTLYRYDFQRPKCTLGEKSFYGAHQTNLNEDRRILSVAKCRPMRLVARCIRYMRIFAGIAREGASKDSGVVDDEIFGN